MQATSTTTIDAKKRVATLWKEFIASDYVKDKVDGAPFLRNLAAIDKMDSVGSLCVQDIYEHFAEWMTCIYLSRDKKPLGPGTLDSYFGYLMVQARARALKIARGEIQVTKASNFFSCSSGDTNVMTDEVRWFRGVKHNMRRKSIARLTEKGEAIDNSADPLYAADIAKINETYARVGGAESAVRSCLLIATWQTAGRTTECVYLSYDNMFWDRQFCCIEVEIVQYKTSKVKRLPLVASANHHMCFFTRLGDMLALERTVSYRPDDMGSWLFPKFQSKDQAGAAINRILKDVDVRQENAKHKVEAKASKLEFAANATVVGASVRPGAISTLYADIPANQVVCTSGHDMSGDSKMFGYVDVNVATCMPGATVLAGWPSPGYGKPTKGPRPASVDALAHQGADMKLVDDIVDEVFDLDPAHPPMLLRAEVRRAGDGEFVNPGGTPGALRPAVLCAFASLVMHYEERSKNGFFLPVQVKLETAVSKAYSGRSSHAKLTEWGNAIRDAFVADNIHLSAYHETEGTARIVSMLQSLARQQGQVAQNQRALENALESALRALPGAIGARMEEHVAELGSRVENALQLTPMTRRRRVAQDDGGEEDNMIVDGEGEGDGGNTALAMVPVHDGVTSGADEDGHGAIVAVAGDVETDDAAGLHLHRTHPTQFNAPVVCAARDLNELFRMYMEAGAPELSTYAPFGRNPQMNSDARHGLGLLYEMATSEEREKLKKKEETRVKRMDLVDDLVVLARAWWAALLKGQELSPPNSCAKPKPGSRPEPAGLFWAANLRKKFKKDLPKDLSARAKHMDMRKCGVAAWRRAWEAEKAQKQYPSQCKYPAAEAPWEIADAEAKAAAEGAAEAKVTIFGALFGRRDSTGA